MKTTTLAILTVAAGLAVAGVVMVEGRARPAETEAAATGARFVPALQQRINDVAVIEVNRAGEPLTLRREGDSWVVAEKGDYPAQLEKVRGVLVGLSELRTAEAMTAKPENYAKLGVQDPPATPQENQSAPGTPTMLTLKDGKDQTIAAVIVGSTRWGAQPGVYTRRAGEAQSFFAHGTLDIPANITQWADSKVLDLMRDRVSQARIQHADGETVLITRANPIESSFTIQNVPEGKELRSPSAGDALGAALAYLTFENVAPAGARDFSAPVATAEYRTFDGLILTIKMTEQDGQTWGQFAAAYDETVLRPENTGTAQLLSSEEAQKQAEELSARFSRWIFQIPDWKAVTLKSRMAGFYKDTPPAMPPSMQGVEMMDPAQLVQPPPPPPATAPQG